MKSLRRIGCLTFLALIVALGTLVFLFTPLRQGRTDFSGRPIRGNVAFLGGDVKIERDEHIRGNLLVVGDDLVLEGQIGGNLVVVGGDAELVADSHVGGNVSVIGGDAEVSQAAQIGGNIAVVGGDASLTGVSRVGGNVNVIGGKVARDQAAQVGGSSSWRVFTNRVAQPGLYADSQSSVAGSRAELQQPDPPRAPVPPQREAQGATAELQAQAAQMQEEAQRAATELQARVARIQEETQRAQAEFEAQANLASHRPPWFIIFLGKLAQAFLWTLLITGLVLLFVWLMPKQVERIARTAQEETALSFAAGAITVMGSALLAAILTITICFALLAFPLLALLALVILCGWTVTCYWLGRHLDALLASQSSLSWNPLVSIALCSLFMTGVTAFAWAIFACLGFIVAVLIGSTGTGAVVVHLARSSGRQSNGASRTDANAPAPTEEPDIQIEAPVDGESPAEAASLTAAGGATSEEVDDTRSEAEMAASAGPTPKEAPPEDSPLQAEADDLTRMAGIGPTYAMRLRDGGITTFAQLAELEVGKIAAVLGWSTARVERERLRERAADLAATQ